MTVTASVHAMKTIVVSSHTQTSSRTAAVVGGSLGGLAAAHALSQTGWIVDVYELSPTELRNKGSGLGFVNVPHWEYLTKRPMYRRGQRANRAQGSYFYGDLWGYLYDGLNTKKVQVYFDRSVTIIQDSITNTPKIDNKEYDLVVLADGGFSKLRQAYVLPKTHPKYAGYVVWRGSVDESKLTPTLRHNIRYLEGVHKNGIYDTIVLKMAKDNGDD